MFLVEGGMSFDTRNAVAGARAFQRELKNTSKAAEDASRSGAKLEGSFKAAEARGALRGLQVQLMGIKDGTDAAIAGAKALQIALVKSVAGTAIIGSVGVLSDSVRDVGAKIGAAADEANRASKGFIGFANSIEEGSRRADTLTQSADNTLKALEGLKNAGIFQAGVFKLFGGENVLKDLEDATRGAARAEFGVGAQAERMTAERRIGMTPEQIAADKRKQEEEKRLREARARGGPRAEADVARAIAAENLQRDLEKGLEAQKKFDADVSASAKKVEDAKRKAKEETRKAEIDGLDTAQKIIELEKEAASVSSQLAEITKNGIYGTDEKRKAQLEEIENLNMRLLDLEKSKADAIKQQELNQIALRAAKDEEAEKARGIELEEIIRQRNLRRARADAAAETKKLEQEQRRGQLEEELKKFFGAGAWSSIPENIKNQMLISGVSNQHLSMISRNTTRSGAGGFQQRPKSGVGMERPPGYIPSPSGVDVLFSENRGGVGNLGGSRDRGNARSVMRGTPSVISANNPYQRTRVRGQDGIQGDLASAIQSLANKIPAAVPV